MVENKITPLLLAGGSGTRLWPLSRKSYPKQFSNLIGDKTLFQQSAQRLTSSEELEFKPHIIITNSAFRFIVLEQLQSVGVDPGQILIESEPKNTAPAILAASFYEYERDPESIILAAPCDHLIPDKSAFNKAVKIGLDQVKLGKMVTFGIYPTYPETGYGYIEVNEESADSEDPSTVVRFVEKPELSDAEKMIAAGKYLWNAGIFMFKAADMIEAFKTFAPNILNTVKEAVETAKEDLSFLRLNPEPWSKAENISLDFAIMEKAKNLLVVPYKAKWSDLGTWEAVWSELAEGDLGVAVSANAHPIDCSNTLLRSESSRQQIVGIGLENVIAIAMPDAVLVAQKERSQEVKKVVDYLNLKNISQAETFPKDHRPWGWFESLALGDQFQVKRICVKPEAALSLQSHSHRSEHWIVVEGIAKVKVDDDIKLLSEGQSVYVPKGAIHRLENPGKSPMVLIEVQTGVYLGEDDIVRYEDLYARD